MRWLLILPLAVIVSLATVKTASAELLYETINDIQVPTNVTWGTQIEWQGHIVYEVKDVGTTYQVKVARDGEPHQYPYFYVSFSKNWEYLGTTKHVNPEAERRAAEDAARKAKEAQDAQRKAQEDQARQEQERLRREEEDRKKPKPEQPPVVKPPDEEPPEEPEEPEEPTGE